ncbi:hypothetical protein EV127DRAFT_411099 [Xylaria flabelliformis]|nr:hypothetical protein EV127DRAFT_411099 [Xylaria flabelliformis]
MHHSDSQVPRRTSSRKRNADRSISRNYNDHVAYQAPVDISENAYDIELFDGAIQAAQNLVPGMLSSADPPLTSDVVVNSNAYWPIMQSSFGFSGPDVSISHYEEFSGASRDSSLPILNSSTVLPLDPPYTTAFLSLLANESAANGFYDWQLNQQYPFNSALTETTPALSHGLDRKGLDLLIL